jgi:hypothetical protein
MNMLPADFDVLPVSGENDELFCEYEQLSYQHDELTSKSDTS